MACNCVSRMYGIELAPFFGVCRGGVVPPIRLSMSTFAPDLFSTLNSFRCKWLAVPGAVRGLLRAVQDSCLWRRTVGSRARFAIKSLRRMIPR